MSGYEVARTFREDEALRLASLVALTAYATVEDRQLAAEAGFARHIAKPPNPERIEEVLRELASVE